MMSDAGREPVDISVLVMTYNHRAYIRQALDSVLAQQHRYRWEVIVSEDCSTDGTTEIVLDYAARHPDLIRPILSPQNIRSNEVVARGIRAARGRYVALLDGDDYWLEPTKLQQQVEFLDAQPDYTVCFHNATVVDDRSEVVGRLWNDEQQRACTALVDLTRGNYLATSTVMYRRAAVPEIPNWYYEFFPITDWPLHILFAEHGLVGYLSSVMAAYRFHQEGCFSPQTPLRKLQANAEFYERMQRFARPATRQLLLSGQFQYFGEWAEEYLRQGNSEMAHACLQWARHGQPWRSWPACRKYVQLVLKWNWQRLWSNHKQPSTELPSS